MGFSGGGGGQTLPHTHDNNIINDGGSLNFDNVTQGGMAAGDITYSDGNHLQILTYPAVPAGETLTAVAASTAPSWAAAAESGLQILRYRLPMENEESISIDQLYRMGNKDWKVTQTAKPFLFEGNNNADLSAMSDDMTGYANDTEFDAVWPSSDTTNLAPSAAANQIECSIANGVDGACYFDIGHTIENNSVWTLFFSLATTARGTGNKKYFIGLTDDTSDFTSSQAAVGMTYGSDNEILSGGAVAADPLDQVGGGDGSFSVLGDSTNRYFVMNGLGFGRFSITMYSGLKLGKNYETETRTFSWTAGTTATNLRYIKIAAWSKVNGTACTFNVSNVMFAESDHPMLVFNK
jgi:hypothetical protein